MNERERLIELLNDIQRCGEDYTEYERYGINYPDTVSNENVSDHLLANGVTVSQQTEPKTNGDRIRAMTDEELARFIGYNSLCDQIQNDNGAWCKKQRECKGCLVEWLKQPVREEEKTK